MRDIELAKTLRIYDSFTAPVQNMEFECLWVRVRDVQWANIDTEDYITLYDLIKNIQIGLNRTTLTVFGEIFSFLKSRNANLMMQEVKIKTTRNFIQVEEGSNCKIEIIKVTIQVNSIAIAFKDEISGFLKQQFIKLSICNQIEIEGENYLNNF